MTQKLVPEAKNGLANLEIKLQLKWEFHFQITMEI